MLETFRWKTEIFLVEIKSSSFAYLRLQKVGVENVNRVFVSTDSAKAFKTIRFPHRTSVLGSLTAAGGLFEERLLYFWGVPL